MSPDKYRQLRKAMGTQAEVAGLLGLARETVNGRETGREKITKESALALLALSIMGYAEGNTGMPSR